VKFNKTHLNRVRGKNNPTSEQAAPSLTSKSLEDHYIADRAIYDEIYNRTGQQIKHQRRLNYSLLVLVFLLTLGLIFVGSQSKTEMAVVKVDVNNNILSIEPAQKLDLASAIPNATAYFMQEFIVAARTVSVDYTVQAFFQKKAFAFTEGAATKILSDFFVQRTELVNNREKTIEVTFENALPNLGGSSESIQIRWLETTKSIKTGDVITQKRFTGQFAYELTENPPTDSDILTLNPLGFYVRHITWAEDFSYVS